MVAGGQAHCYMLSGPEQAMYRAAEAEAKEKERGLWKDRKPQVPREFRIQEEKKKSSNFRLKVFMAAAVIIAALTMLIITNHGKFTG